MLPDAAAAEGGPRRNRGSLIRGERAVGTIADGIVMSRPRVSKHLRVLSRVGLVRSRAGRRRWLGRVGPTNLWPWHEWMVTHEPTPRGRLDHADAHPNTPRHGERA